MDKRYLVARRGAGHHHPKVNTLELAEQFGGHVTRSPGVRVLGQSLREGALIRARVDIHQRAQRSGEFVGIERRAFLFRGGRIGGQSGLRQVVAAQTGKAELAIIGRYVSCRALVPLRGEVQTIHLLHRAAHPVGATR